MIDDLVRLGADEPYRMFTSRAEYRLRLRADNADQRLTGKGIAAGCVGFERAEVFEAKAKALEQARALTMFLRAGPGELAKNGIKVPQDGITRSAAEYLAFGDVDMGKLTRIWPELDHIASEISEQIEIDARYAPYLRRQEADVEAYRRDEALGLPDGLDYASISGLTTEIREKLEKARPESLGAAARIPGVTPAALVLLLRHVRRGQGEPRKTA